MLAISSLISAANSYIKNNKETRRFYLIKKFYAYVKKMLTIFGLNYDSSDSKGQSNGVDRQSTLAPYLNALSSFRNEIRTTALSKDLYAQKILDITDNLRNRVLPPLGVRLDDSDEFPWKLDDPEVLMAEIKKKKDEANLVQSKKN